MKNRLITFYQERRRRDSDNRNRKNQRKDDRDQPPKKDDSFQWQKASKTFAFWLVIFILMIWFSRQLGQDSKQEAEISYPVFKRLLVEQKIESAEIKEKDFHGVLKQPESLTESDKQYEAFVTQLPEEPDFELVDKWVQEYGIEINFEEKSLNWWGYLLNFLPWVLIIAVWLFFLRRMQGGGTKGIFSFGKSRAKMLTTDRTKVTFQDVAGADEAKQELIEIIEFLKEPDKFQRLGGKIPKGALLLGPPGTGKTLLAKAVAGEAGVPFFSMSGADFVEMFVGVGASRVRDLFEQGKKNAPCIIFIDELDAVGRHRGAGLGGGHDEREQTLNQLLVEMDGFDSNEGVILVAATNRPDVLDAALLRPGRFDRQIVVDRPDVRGREGILKVHTKKIRMGKKVDLQVMAKGTPGFSGADLANMVNEAALLAARKNKKQVEMEDMEEAKDKVLMGTERKSLLISEKEKKSTAYHEAGHALVAKLLPEADPVHKVTIIPRGRSLGATTTLPMDEKHNYSQKYCESMLCQLLGGRIAEKMVLDQYTTGAGNDLERATELARKMVCEWGMSDVMGPLTFGKKQEEIFLGREIAQHRDYSEQTAKLIDSEVKRFVMEASELAEKLISENFDKLHELAKALLEKENLDVEAINAIFGENEENEIADQETSSDTSKEDNGKE
ncbi:ATP-dependent zinc metalloprotease FtsH [candidate division KSB1 bacterium]|nr:ATP-dependent zinc metalloprotease FtsH [candidate division KSB1 bacterium]